MRPVRIARASRRSRRRSRGRTRGTAAHRGSLPWRRPRSGRCGRRSPETRTCSRRSRSASSPANGETIAAGTSRSRKTIPTAFSPPCVVRVHRDGDEVCPVAEDPDRPGELQPAKVRVAKDRGNRRGGAAEPLSKAAHGSAASHGFLQTWKRRGKIVILCAVLSARSRGERPRERSTECPTKRPAQPRSQRSRPTGQSHWGQKAPDPSPRGRSPRRPRTTSRMSRRTGQSRWDPSRWAQSPWDQSRLSDAAFERPGRDVQPSGPFSSDRR